MEEVVHEMDPLELDSSEDEPGEYWEPGLEGITSTDTLHEENVSPAEVKARLDARQRLEREAAQHRRQLMSDCGFESIWEE